MMKFRFQLSIILFFLVNGSTWSQDFNVQHMGSIEQLVRAPLRVTVDLEDNLYVSDASLKAVLRYNAAGIFLDTIYKGEYPLSVAVNNLGHVVVGEGESGEILKIVEGQEPMVFYSGLLMPASMKFDRQGTLYVVDSKGKQVVVLDASATLLSSFGSDTLVFPSSISIDESGKRILVAEQGGVGPSVLNCGGWNGYGPALKIYIYDMEGNLEGGFGCHGSDPGEFERIQGMVTDKCGNLFVLDPFEGSVTVFDKELAYCTQFGEWGSNSGQLNLPLDIAMDSKNRLIIPNLNNENIEFYSLDYFSPIANIVSQDTTICQGDSALITV